MQPILIALTLGDPAGIGPEVAVAAWGQGGFPRGCRAFVLGHPDVVRRAVRLRGLDLRVVEISSPRDVPEEAGVIACLNCVRDEAADVPAAVMDARGGQAAYDATVAAAQLALRGEIDAMVTGPLNKAALHAAGHHYPGHTELLAEPVRIQERGDDALSGCRRQCFGAHWVGRGACHTAHGDARSVRSLECGLDRRRGAIGR